MSYEELHTALMRIRVKLILEIIMDISNNMYRYTQFSKCHYALRIYNITDYKCRVSLLSLNTVCASACVLHSRA
jgi:hypothetical protein